METEADAPRSPRLLLALGLLCLLGGFLFMGADLFVFENGTPPSYLPPLTTFGAALLLLALRRRRGLRAGLIRFGALGLAIFAWLFVYVLSGVPDYEGSPLEGRPFPEFSLERPSGPPLTRNDLLGTRHIVIFYRNW